jgi:hypothetical protein
MDLRKHEGIIEAAQLITDVLQEVPQAKQKLASVGFGTGQCQTGIKLTKAAEGHLATRLHLEQERWALSQQINAGLEAVRDEFRHNVKAARFALQNDPKRLHALNIDQLTSTTWGSVKQTIYFYQQLQQQNVSLDAFGVDAKSIQNALTTATQLLQQKKTRTQKKGLAQQNTREVRESIAALRAWVVEFRANARLAYRQKPQMLEMFGIRVKASV